MNDKQVRVETLMAERLGRAHGIFVRSGTTALWVLLEALDLPNGANVGIPSIVCPQVQSAVCLAGLRPHYLDVTFSDYGIAIDEHANRSNVHAVIAVHGYGIRSNLEVTSAAFKGVPLIEDACLSYGWPGDLSTHNPSRGSVVSFGYDKQIDAGGGGVILVDDVALQRRCRTLASQNKMVSVCPSTDFEKILSGLKKIDAQTAVRAERSSRYKESLLSLSFTIPDGLPLWRYPVLVGSDRDRFVLEASQHGLALSVHYRALHHFRTGFNLRNAERIAREVINLPLSEAFSDYEVERYIAFMNSTSSFAALKN